MSVHDAGSVPSCCLVAAATPRHSAEEEAGLGSQGAGAAVLDEAIWGLLRELRALTMWPELAVGRLVA